MRILLDENLSPSICGLLQAAGHEATHVREAGMTGAPDDAVLAFARAQARVLVTADRADFGRLLAANNDIAPSVVLLRQLPAIVRAADVAALLIANLPGQVTDALDEGAFVVLTPAAIRIRRLPLR